MRASWRHGSPATRRKLTARRSSVFCHAMKADRAWALLACLAAGCSASDAIGVSGSIGNVQVTVSQELFVTTLRGSFDVALELGARASQGTDVTTSNFTLVRADTGATVLSEGKPLRLISSQSTPIRLEPGQATTVHYEVGEPNGANIAPMEADKDDYEAICSSGQLRIVGNMTDSASAANTSLSSAPFAPIGCP